MNHLQAFLLLAWFWGVGLTGLGGRGPLTLSYTEQGRVACRCRLLATACNQGGARFSTTYEHAHMHTF